MDLGIAVDFAGRGLQHLRPAALGHAQHVDRPHHRGLHRLDGIVLVVARRGGAGQVVDLVDLQQDRQRHVVANQLEVRPAEQMGDVRLLAGEEVVEADHVVPLLDQPLAEVRAEKAGAAGDQNAFQRGHVASPPIGRVSPWIGRFLRYAILPHEPSRRRTAKSTGEGDRSMFSADDFRQIQRH